MRNIFHEPRLGQSTCLRWHLPILAQRDCHWQAFSNIIQRDYAYVDGVASRQSCLISEELDWDVAVPAVSIARARVKKDVVVVGVANHHVVANDGVAAVAFWSVPGKGKPLFLAAPDTLLASVYFYWLDGPWHCIQLKDLGEVALATDVAL